jgi:transcriptional regulator with XRE-family HTH domain
MSDAITTSTRRPVAYELPTPEKRAWGARLRYAREVAGLTLTKAASALGYSQPVQLSLMENGARPVTLRVVVECARLYGTTADFLCGLADESERDPLVACQRVVAARVVAEVRGLVVTLCDAGAAAARELRPDSGRLARLAAAVLDADRALGVVRASLAGFDDEARGGAALVARLGLAAELAREHVAAVERARRIPSAGASLVAGLAVASEMPGDVDAVLRVDRFLAPVSGVADEHEEADPAS